MSEYVSFIQGSKENYNPSEMQGGLFLSKDTKEILLNGESYGNATPADEEDITAESGNLKLRDRAYDAANFSGKGYTILRKNIVDGKNVLTQEMVSESNTVYEIRYDFDLNGAEIVVPEGCILRFDGGSFSNGTLSGLNTIISSDDLIFNNISFSGKFSGNFYFKWVCNSAVTIQELSLNINGITYLLKVASGNDCSSLIGSTIDSIHDKFSGIIFDGSYFLSTYIDVINIKDFEISGGGTFYGNGFCVRKFNNIKIHDLNFVGEYFDFDINPSVDYTDAVNDGDGLGSYKFSRYSVSLLGDGNSVGALVYNIRCDHVYNGVYIGSWNATSPSCSLVTVSNCISTNVVYHGFASCHCLDVLFYGMQVYKTYLGMMVDVSKGSISVHVDNCIGRDCLAPFKITDSMELNTDSCTISNCIVYVSTNKLSGYTYPQFSTIQAKTYAEVRNVIIFGDNIKNNVTIGSFSDDAEIVIKDFSVIATNILQQSSCFAIHGDHNCKLVLDNILIRGGNETYLVGINDSRVDLYSNVVVRNTNFTSNENCSGLFSLRGTCDLTIENCDFYYGGSSKIFCGYNNETTISVNNSTISNFYIYASNLLQKVFIENSTITSDNVIGVVESSLASYILINNRISLNSDMYSAIRIGNFTVKEILLINNVITGGKNYIVDNPNASEVFVNSGNYITSSTGALLVDNIYPELSFVGLMKFNQEINLPEWYDGTEWVNPVRNISWATIE